MGGSQWTVCFYLFIYFYFILNSAEGGEALSCMNKGDGDVLEAGRVKGDMSYDTKRAHSFLKMIPDKMRV